MVKTKLTISDKAPMMKKKMCFEASDRSLKDLLYHKNFERFNLPFGGKCVVLGGGRL